MAKESLLCLSSPSSSAQGLWHLLEPTALLAKEDADADTFPSGGRGTWPRSSLCCQCSFCHCFHLSFRLWLKCHLLQETSLIALSDIALTLFMLLTDFLMHAYSLASGPPLDGKLLEARDFFFSIYLCFISRAQNSAERIAMINKYLLME